MREYLEYLESLEGLEVKYLDCPFECQYEKPRYSATRATKCNQCPRALLKRDFERAVVKVWQLKLGKAFSVPAITETIEITMGALNTPDGELSKTMSFFVNTYHAEQNRKHKMNEK